MQGVKEFIQSYKKSFDREASAIKKAKKILKDRGERATKEAVQSEKSLILAEWDRIRENSSLIHNNIAKEDLSSIKNCIYDGYIPYDGIPLSEIDESCNIVIKGNTYLEKKIVYKKYNLIGYIDKIEVSNDLNVTITDHKVWNDIYFSSSYTAENGYRVAPTFFNHPISHLQDCNFIEASLQMSMYAYIIWTFNKKLKIDKLQINHIKVDDSGAILDKNIIKVPYLLKEVKDLLKNAK